ncbi:MAG: hypothetical protein LBI98_03030 [Endomicrobium sp.]|jgi:Co/Zn/Cd efflux system component|nr:hypothetical protein [Endomicrobium sp.]
MKKKTRTSSVLIIGFTLIFLQVIGAFYSKSFALLSYSGLIIINVFSSFLKFMHPNGVDVSLLRAQIVSIILNSLTLFILALFIITKASISTSVQAQKIINIHIAEVTTTTVFIGLIFCSFIDIQFIITTLLSLFLILGFYIHIFERIVSLDYYLSTLFAILIMIQTALLIKNSVKMLKKYSGLSPKKLK